MKFRKAAAIPVPPEQRQPEPGPAAVQQPYIAAARYMALAADEATDVLWVALQTEAQDAERALSVVSYLIFCTNSALDAMRQVTAATPGPFEAVRRELDGEYQELLTAAGWQLDLALVLAALDGTPEARLTRDVEEALRAAGAQHGWLPLLSLYSRGAGFVLWRLTEGRQLNRMELALNTSIAAARAAAYLATV